MRLGFAVKVVGRPGLKATDTRRWQSNPHLSVSLAYLRDVFLYLEQMDICMYRMSPDLAPYVTHPDLPQFHTQIDECADELAALGRTARDSGLRLSFHPYAHVVLNSPDEDVAHKAMSDLNALALILDRMGLGPEAVIVIHVGGVYGDKAMAVSRFVLRHAHLPQATRSRLALENDDRAYTIRDTHAIYQQTGIRLVLDQLHRLCNPASSTTLGQALELALNTWPPGQTPKVHFSSPRTSLITAEPRDRSGTRVRRPFREPRLRQHAHLIDPFSFINLLRATGHCRDYDVMLECKARDVGLLRLRRHLDRLAPDLVRLHNIV